MKPTVYVETTIFSLLVDTRAESVYRRRWTMDWWRTQRKRFNVYTSPFVIDELNVPVYPGWQKALAVARRQTLLAVTDDLLGIIQVYIDNLLMPRDDAGDAAHLAMASIHEVDYLLTWNCRHLANANKFDHIRAINRRLGLLTPEIATPEQLFEE